MKIFLDTIGCRLNQAEIESMARQFRAAGHEIVASAEDADLAVVNTCAVTGEAASEFTRADPPDRSTRGRCARSSPQAAGPRSSRTRRPPSRMSQRGHPQLEQGYHWSPTGSDLPGQASHAFDLEPFAAHASARPAPRARAPLSRCRMAATITAPSASRPSRAARGARASLAGGARRYPIRAGRRRPGDRADRRAPWLLGTGFRPRPLHLRDLVTGILRETDVPRLRLSSLEPWDLDAEFFALWEDCPPDAAPAPASAERLRCHAEAHGAQDQRPPPSGAGRRCPPGHAAEAGHHDRCHRRFSRRDRAASSPRRLDFVREMEFAGGHVFTYSPRPGTGAARLAGQVRMEVRKERNHILHAALDESAQRYRQGFIGRNAGRSCGNRPPNWASGAGKWRVDRQLPARSATASAPRWNAGRHG